MSEHGEDWGMAEEQDVEGLSAEAGRLVVEPKTLADAAAGVEAMMRQMRVFLGGIKEFAELNERRPAQVSLLRLNRRVRRSGWTA